MMHTSPRAALFLADGSRFDGHGLGFEGTALGEAVFYTGMTGYEEALTDPSYAGQILTFTYPMIGNYGISGGAAQYRRACVAGTVIKQIAQRPSHHLAKESLPAWLDEQELPTLIGADTRAITISLREHGTIWAALAVGDAALARSGAEAHRVRTHCEHEGARSERRDPRTVQRGHPAGKAHRARRLRRKARDPATARSTRGANRGGTLRRNKRGGARFGPRRGLHFPGTG